MCFVRIPGLKLNMSYVGLPKFVWLLQVKLVEVILCGYGFLHFGVSLCGPQFGTQQPKRYPKNANHNL